MPASERSRVRLYDPADPDDQRALDLLRRSGAIEHSMDVFPDLLDDLFRIEFPFVAPGTPVYECTRARYLDARWNGGRVSQQGVWAHLPWRRALVHLPSEPDFLLLRTARNRYLVSPQEQAAFYDARVGVGGLSVGLSVVTTLVLSGGARHLRVADHDVLGVTNLNRLLGSVSQLGMPKTEICAQRVYELNPFQQLELFDGLTDDVLSQFFGDGDESLAVFVEEMDDIRMKALSRFEARRRGIPVVMATDNGDNAVIDVERFDLEPDRPLFHAMVPEDDLKMIPEHPSLADRVRLASAIVGSNITPRTQMSLQQVGAQLPTWPQLGTAAALSGVAATYVVRRILTGAPMPSGRYFVDLDSTLDVDFDSFGAVINRKQSTDDFVHNLDAMFGFNR